MPSNSFFSGDPIGWSFRKVAGDDHTILHASEIK